MTTTDTLIVLIIYLIIPLLGIGLLIKLLNQIKKDKTASPPSIDFFIIFFNYGGLLTTILTSLLWEWSGLASVGAFYLITVAPILMGIIAYKNRPSKDVSKYYNLAYKAGVSYFAFGIIMLLLFTLDGN